MSLSELIRFRKLDNELTDNEFFNKFCKSIGRKVIIDSLFAHLQNNLNEVKTVTSIQSNILNKKKEKKAQAAFDCIDNLPSEMISECGSFLPYRDYFKFSRCNRSIYYSLHSQPKIYKLCLNIIIGNMPKRATLHAFKNVKTLLMNIKNFNKLSASNQAIWVSNTNLKNLSLDLGNCDDSDILRFQNISHLLSKCRALQSLSIYTGSAKNVFNTLSKFESTSVTHLHLGHFVSSNSEEFSFTRSDISSKLPNVESLDLVSVDQRLALHLLNAFHRDLKSFKFISRLNRRSPQSTSNALSFPALKILQLVRPPPMKSFYGVTTLEEAEFTLSKKNDIKKIFKWMSSQQSLKYLKLRVMKIIESDIAYENIEKQLVENNDIGEHSHHLKIRLEMHRRCNVEKLPFQIFRLLRAMQMLNQKKWTLQINQEIPGDSCIDLSILEKLKKNIDISYACRRNHFKHLWEFVIDYACFTNECIVIAKTNSV